MIEANAGDFLDDATPMRIHWPTYDPRYTDEGYISYPAPVFQTRVVDPCYQGTSTEGRSSGGIRCPVCGAIVRTISLYDEELKCKCWHFYCYDCWLVFDRVRVGTLYEDGTYIER